MKKRIFTGMVCVLVLLCSTGCAGRQPEVIWSSSDGRTAEPEEAEAAGQAQIAAVSSIGSEAGAADGNISKEAQAMDGAEADGSGARMDEAPAEKIFVDICGAVRQPGVYELEAGMRVCDAVAAAGGLLENADLASLNQAAFLEDAAKIYVYTQEEAVQRGVSASEQGGLFLQGGSEQTAKVNINTADIAQLCTLSGIGEARAGDIIAYREANGGFQSPEEIMNVSGIKEATFQKIKEEIAVR